MLRKSTALLIVSVALVASCGSSAPAPIRGVRLGMTPAQVRARFDPGGPGTYRSEAMDEDFALVWEPSGAGPVLSARHEFHLGQLVALRLTLRPDSDDAGGPEIETTELSVLTRESQEAAVAVTWLSRSCPTHADEVERRIQDHR